MLDDLGRVRSTTVFFKLAGTTTTITTAMRTLPTKNLDTDGLVVVSRAGDNQLAPLGRTRQHGHRSQGYWPSGRASCSLRLRMYVVGLVGGLLSSYELRFATLAGNEGRGGGRCVQRTLIACLYLPM